MKQSNVELAQVPTSLSQIIFIIIMLWQPTTRAMIYDFSRVQKICVVLLLLYITAATLASDAKSGPAIGTFCIIHLLFFVTLIAYSRTQNLGSSAPAWTILGATALIHAIAFFISWIGWPDLIRQGHFLSFGNIRHLGYFLAPAAAAMAVRYVMVSENSLLSLCCYIAAAFYLIYTGSRGGAVAAVSGLMIIAVYCLWHRYRPNWTRVLILISVTFLLSLLSELVPTLPWKPLFTRGVDAMTQSGAEMLGGRAEVWKSTIEAIMVKPLLGHGPALMWQIPEYLGITFQQPHNILLQFLLHWGFVGTFLILATVAAFTRNSWVAIIRQPAQAIVPFAVFTTMSIHGMVDGGLFYPYSTVIAIIAFASLEGIGFRQRALVV